MKNLTIIAILFYLLAAPVSVQASIKEEDPDPQWTIINIYQVQNSASGLAWDGEYFYVGSFGGGESNKVYRFNPATSTNEFLFDAPESTMGMTWDGNHLWITHSQGLSNPSRATKMDMQGNIVDHFSLPARMMSGIAYDNGNFWAARYESPFHKIYHLELQDGAYVPVDSFPTPTSQPWEIARQEDFLWITDYNRSEIHKTDLQGNLINTYPASLHRTSGVVYDGQHLWYLSRSSQTGTPSFLYQVDLDGGGTPEIVVEPSYDFGNVTLENNASWVMEIGNTGTGRLTIEDMVLPENTAFSTDKIFPFHIAAGDTDQIEITFSPSEINHQEVTALLQTNDPANLEIEIQLEGIGLASGPYMLSHQQEVDFGTVRINSSTKKFFVFQNMGDAPLEITQAQLNSSLFYFDSYVDFPYVLDPVQTVEIPFWFLPDNTQAIESTATVVFNNDQSPLEIEIKGQAHQTEYAAGDLLWQHQFPGPVWNHATSVLTVPDLNEDGIPDVMLTTRTGYLRVFNANASEGSDLIWERHLGIVDFPRAVALASDINGDGLTDIIAGTAISDQAITAVSSRTGENIWRVETTSLEHPGWIYMVDVSHDFNGNGYLDVVAAIGNNDNSTGSVICINGQNGEIIWQTQLNAVTYTVMVAQDFTGDGIPDVVAGANAPMNKGKVVALNGETGQIEWQTEAAASVRGLGQLNDITENGVPDIIAGSLIGIYYLIDATSGEIKITGSTNTRIYDLYNAGDLNFNGHPVFVPSAGLTNNLNAICGKSGQAIWTITLDDVPVHVAVIPDITGNGTNDIAVATRPNQNKIYLINGSQGAIVESFALDQGAEVIGSFADITGNGNVEIITSTSSGFLGVYSCGTKPDAVEYALSFTVKNSAGLPLEGALINFAETDDELFTDSQGQAMINLLTGSYSYNVNLENYTELSGTVIVTQDTHQEVILQSPEFSVTFIVTSNDTPLENVSIGISAAKTVVVTDANGIASVDLPAGNYSFTAEKDNFIPANDQFQLVDDDIVVILDMEADVTGIPEHQTQKFRSFPNPFASHINVEYWLSHDQSVTLSFYHSNGNIAFSETIAYAQAGLNTFSWNAAATTLKAGVYFLEIKTEDFIYRDRIIFTGR